MADGYPFLAGMSSFGIPRVCVFLFFPCYWRIRTAFLLQFTTNMALEPGRRSWREEGALPTSASWKSARERGTRRGRRSPPAAGASKTMDTGIATTSEHFEVRERAQCGYHGVDGDVEERVLLGACQQDRQQQGRQPITMAALAPPLRRLLFCCRIVKFPVENGWLFDHQVT